MCCVLEKNTEKTGYNIACNEFAADVARVSLYSIRQPHYDHADIKTQLASELK